MKKSPREILLHRHQSVENKLDEIRENALSHMSHEKAQRTPSTETFSLSGVAALRELLLSLRWHLAGMSAAWLLIAFLNLDNSPMPTTDVARKSNSSPQQLGTALRENRRLLAEMLESSPSLTEPAPAPPSFPPRRRSESQTLTERA